MAFLQEVIFHKTFDFLIIFYLKLLCNNVTMYILYVLQNFSGEHNISQEEYINGTVYTGALWSPAGYTWDQDAIKYIRDTFQKEMGREMHLERISAPLFVEKSSGLMIT